MHVVKLYYLFITFVISLLSLSCHIKGNQPGTPTIAFTGGNIIDGTGKAPIKNGVILVRNGRIISVGTRDSIMLPDNTRIIDLTGKTVIPGLINSHGHVGDVKGLHPNNYSVQNIHDQLALYAKYGITTVVSLGGDRKEAETFRAVLDTTISPGRARLYIAGTIITGDSPEGVADSVNRNVEMGVDIIKIRVDDNLGTSSKMPEEIYKAVIKQTHEHHLKLAAHMYYLQDAKSLLVDGADFLAHSVRDQQVDQELILLLKEKKAGYCPTLTREVSTFVYETTPDFFSDPFFLREADTSVICMLKDHSFQEKAKESRSAQMYKQALQTAMKNLKILSNNGVTIVMGTDTGMPGRFQGYFEHLKMELMAKAGMSPMQIIISATKDAALCLNLKDVGTLEAGKWADLLVLDQDPLADIKNTRSISSVWIGGNKIDR